MFIDDKIVEIEWIIHKLKRDEKEQTLNPKPKLYSYIWKYGIMDIERSGKYQCISPVGI